MTRSMFMFTFLLISVLAVGREAAGVEYITRCRPIGVSLLELRTDSNHNHPSKQVRMVEARLKELHYNPGKVDGKADSHTYCALMGFQRMNGLEPNFRMDLDVVEALKNPVQPKPSVRHDGIYAEADLTRQILTVYSGGEIVRILPISSGSGKVFTEVGEGPQVAKTPVGNFIFFSHIWGLHKSHLGDLFNPVYFHDGGFAVHGDRLVPPYPASHGCLRITVEDSKWFVNEVPLDTPLLISEKALPASHNW